MAPDPRPPDPPIANNPPMIIDGTPSGMTKKFASNFNRSFAQTVATSSSQQRSSQRVLPSLSYNPRSFLEKDGVPIVKFSQDEIREMEKQFATTVVAKFSAGRPPMAKISEIISNEWGLAEPASLCLVDPRHILIYLKSQEDCVKALARDSNVMEKALYRVFRWDPDFSPKHEPVRMATWVRLPNLPTKFFNPDTLAVIGNAIGTFLRVDSRTYCFSFAMYARLCVEIDVTKQRKEKIWISTGGDTGFYQRVIFESKLLYCSKCGLHGHDISICRKAIGAKNWNSRNSEAEHIIHKEKQGETLIQQKKQSTQQEKVYNNPTRINKQGDGWHFVEKGKPKSTPKSIPTMDITKSAFGALENLEENDGNRLLEQDVPTSSNEKSSPNVEEVAKNDLQIQERQENEHVLHHVEDSPILEKETEKVVMDDSIPEPQRISTPKRSNIGKSKEYHGTDAPALEISMFLHKEAESPIQKAKIISEATENTGLDIESEDNSDSDYEGNLFRKESSRINIRGKTKLPVTRSRRVIRVPAKYG